MSKKMLSIMLGLLLIMGLFAGCSKGEKDFPNKIITIIVPYSPGGASDTVARLYAQELEKEIGTSVVVTNKTGASGAVGLESVKNSKADGYTIAYMPVESTMIKSLGLTDITSDDFTFIGRAMTIPAAVTVRSDAPWNTLEEFLQYAKENPGKVQVGNSGTGSIWHISAALLEDNYGCEFTHVPFDGAAPAIAALLGDNIDAVTVSPSEVKSGVDSGDFKVLAVLGEDKSSIVPDVSTAKEQGIDVIAQGWGAFAVPKGTPDDVVKILEDATKVALNSDNIKTLLAERGFEHAYMSGADMDAYAKEQLVKFSDLIPKLGIVK
ncbi:tripartite tricarboxylate transporter substrate binding protein [Fusibacter bizertensis]